MQRCCSWTYLDPLDVSVRCTSAVCDFADHNASSPATMTDDSIKTFGTSVPMKRAGQPVEVATCFVFLASADSSYIRCIPSNGRYRILY